MSQSFEKATVKSMIESFQVYCSKQVMIGNYPRELLESRYQIVTWLNFLCENLSFRKETLYRAISIYDIYISKVNQNFSMYQIKLIAIACLSLATKIEEINCNFVNFLTSRVLNGQDEEIYKSKDLAMKEIEILKKLNFNLNQSTPYQFLTIFQQIAFNVLDQGDQFKMFLSISESFLLSFMQNNNSILFCSKDIAIYVFNQTILQFNTYFMNTNPKNVSMITFCITHIAQSVLAEENVVIQKKYLNLPKSQRLFAGFLE